MKEEPGSYDGNIFLWMSDYHPDGGQVYPPPPLPLADTATDTRASQHVLLPFLTWVCHSNGGQLFFPEDPIPFVVALGPASCGDDIKPSDMRAFAVPAGKGVLLVVVVVGGAAGAIAAGAGAVAGAGCW